MSVKENVMKHSEDWSGKIEKRRVSNLSPGADRTNDFYFLFLLPFDLDLIITKR